MDSVLNVSEICIICCIFPANPGEILNAALKKCQLGAVLTCCGIEVYQIFCYSDIDIVKAQNHAAEIALSIIFAEMYTSSNSEPLK